MADGFAAVTATGAIVTVSGETIGDALHQHTKMQIGPVGAATDWEGAVSLTPDLALGASSLRLTLSAGAGSILSNTRCGIGAAFMWPSVLVTQTVVMEPWAMWVGPAAS